jgi:hypothetical protein
MLTNAMSFQPCLEISDSHPALAHSPLIRAINKTLGYITDNGPIGLTKSGAFKRVFVQWAAEAFDWPGYRSEDLYAVNKVLNEWDMFPLGEVHDLLLAFKIGRHFKGEFCLTKLGKTFVGHPGRLFGFLAPLYLLEFDHTRHSRLNLVHLTDGWEVFLNAINVKAQAVMSADDLCEVLFEPPDTALPYDPVTLELRFQVLRPLCWLGLLQVVAKEDRGVNKDLYAKTPLWHAALRLQTDAMLEPIVMH